MQEVARGIGLDGRIGAKFLHAGPGFGGSCFPKDTLALVKTAQDADVPLRIVETVVAVNDDRKRAMARKIVEARRRQVRGKTVAVLGLTFKPNTDDMRDAPSIPLVTGLLDLGAKVRALRSGRHGAGAQGITRDRICRRPLQMRARCRCCSHRDRVATIPRA